VIVAAVAEEFPMGRYTSVYYRIAGRRFLTKAPHRLFLEYVKESDQSVTFDENGVGHLTLPPPKGTRFKRKIVWAIGDSDTRLEFCPVISSGPRC